MHVSCRPSVPPIQHSTDVQSLVAGPNPTRQPDLDKQPRNIRNLAFPFTARHSNLFSSTILKGFRFVNNNFNFVADLVATLVLIVYSAIAYIPLDPTPSAATSILSGYPMATNSAPTLQ
jgi:hypothetical protein